MRLVIKTIARKDIGLLGFQWFIGGYPQVIGLSLTLCGTAYDITIARGPAVPGYDTPRPMTIDEEAFLRR